MIKVLIKLLGTIGIIICYLIGLCIVSVWSMNYKKLTLIFIAEFMEYWDITVDEIYVRVKETINE